MSEPDAKTAALLQCEALFERMIAWAHGEAELSSKDLALCLNEILPMVQDALYGRNE